jgi:hypothetical protein
MMIYILKKSYKFMKKDLIELSPTVKKKQTEVTVEENGNEKC